MEKFGYRICEYCSKVCHNEGGLASHLKHKHNKTPQDMVRSIRSRTTLQTTSRGTYPNIQMVEEILA